jgi:hypothetical protein
MLLLIVAILASGGLAVDLCHGTNGAQYTGAYADGSGTYIGSDSVTKPYEFPWIRKCWYAMHGCRKSLIYANHDRYEYYLMSSSLYEADWRLSTGEIHCEGTSACTTTEFNGTEFCQTRSTTVSVKIGIKSALLGVNAGYSLTLTSEGCYAATNTNACQWADGGCHTIWTQQQLLKQVGYIRQRCNDGQRKNNEKVITHCMADFETDNTPTELTNYACGAACGVDYSGPNAPGATSQPSSPTSLSAAATQSTLNSLPTDTRSVSSASSSGIKLGGVISAFVGAILQLILTL